MRIFLNTCAIVAVLFTFIYFATQNSQAVTITYYSGMADSYPLWAVAIIPFFTGIIAGNLLDVLKRFRLSREIRKLRRELRNTAHAANRPLAG